MNVQTRILGGYLFANLVQLEELGKGVSQGLRAGIWPLKGDMRHRVANHAGATGWRSAW
jgi:hypothetical protein